MNGQFTSITELKDTKLVYEKDLPKAGYILLVGVLGFIVAVLLWSIYTKKPYIVVANGTIQGIEKNYIMSEYTGEIYDLNMQEGQDVKKGQSLFKVKTKDIDVQIKQLRLQRKTYTDTVSDYEILIKSIKENKNYFSSSKSKNLYYSQYKAYIAKRNQQTIDEEALRGYGYTEAQIEIERKKIQDLRNEIYYEAINAAASSQKQYQQELEAIDSKIEALQSGVDYYTVKANATGKIHMIGEYHEGMVVQALNTVASISDAKKDNAIITATISAFDRSRIHIGDNAKIVVVGLQQNVYGYIQGKVVEIDSDISVSENGKNSYFKVKIKPKSTSLKSKEGNTVSITNGMAVEARIIYDKISYFNYLMNAIGVKVGY